MLPNKIPSKIIFDFDNTLVDTQPLIHSAFNLTLRDFNLPQWSSEQMQAEIKFSPRDFLPKILGKDNAEKGSQIFLDHYQNGSSKLSPMASAQDLIEYCYNLGIKQYIISNKRGYLLRHEVNNVLKWGHLFENIIGSEDFLNDKPHPAIVEFTIGEKGRSDIWFIGDSDVDIKCAFLSGCFSILVNGEVNENFVHMPDIVVKDLNSILVKIKSIK